MEIKVLGKGCSKCAKLEEYAREAAAELGITPAIIKVTDLNEILGHGVMTTPGLIINGTLKSTGRVALKSEIISWLKAELAAGSAPKDH